MKILFVVDKVSGGAGNVIQLLSMIFRDKGHQPSILFMDGINVKSRYNLSQINLIDFPQKHPELKNKRKLSLILGLKKGLEKEILELNPDVVISFINNNNTLCCMAMRKMNIPLIVSERINTLTCEPKGIWKYMRQFVYKRADKIVVQCRVFEKFCRNWYLEKTVTIPNPVLAPKISNIKKEDNTFTILSAGRLTSQKNFPLLIKAFSVVHKEYPNTKLRIIGQGELMDELKSMSNKLGISECTDIPGYSVNVYDEIAKSDLYVMCSKDEGFPNSLSEAMAVGIPTISYVCHEGIMDLVNDNINGYLIKEDIPEVLAEKIIWVIKHREEALRCGENAKQISDKFSMEKVYNMWLEIIHDVCENYNI